MLTSIHDIRKIPWGIPVLLFLKGNNHCVNGIFSTKFLLLNQFDDDKKCVTARELKKCKVCCDEFVLIPTDVCISFDIGCICGFQVFPDTCVRKCEHPPIEFEDSICGNFAITSGFQEAVIWQSNFGDHQYGRVSIEVEKGEKIGLKLGAYNKFTSMVESYPLFETPSYAFDLSNYSSIAIFKSNLDSEVSGQYEIDLISQIEIN
ncbi:hypothetical protein J2Y03_003572 [Neobacillus niacini]|uniref:S-Ena type endospore appendage n=1 Tax=Neobacillus niacini TaxID=86668 RepID=UPI002866973D|nr:S-Ena type endospore appendage [Neobacillus niacini]MDR7078520.1 hypothetical protein [Neobacillus niacini]